MFSTGFDERIRLALLCDYALTSQDGKVSAIGMFTTINVASLPAVYPRFFVVVVAGLSAGYHSARISLLNPSGSPLIPNGPEMTLEVPNGASDTNLIIGFDNLNFESAGLHQLQLHLDDQVVTTLPFAVMVSGDQEATNFRGSG